MVNNKKHQEKKTQNDQITDICLVSTSAYYWHCIDNISYCQYASNIGGYYTNRFLWDSSNCLFASISSLLVFILSFFVPAQSELENHQTINNSLYNGFIILSYWIVQFRSCSCKFLEPWCDFIIVQSSKGLYYHILSLFQFVYIIF